MIMTRHGGGGLLVVPFPIVVETQKILLVATMTAGGYVALNPTQLASLLGTAARAESHRPRPASDGWRGDP